MFFALALAVVLPLAVVALQAVMYTRRIRFSESIVERSVCAQSEPASARRTIVVLGDSLAVGVGARPEESVAGRLAAAFPHARVFNYSKSGSRACDVLAQLECFTAERADVVLIQVGGNDVLGVHSPAQFRSQLRSVLDRAASLGARVYLMPGNNLCRAPFFVWPAPVILGWRMVRLYAIVRQLAAETGIEFVDMVCDPRDDPFQREPHRYYSPDLLHPSGEGYALYFSALLAGGRLQRDLAPE